MAISAVATVQMKFDERINIILQHGPASSIAVAVSGGPDSMFLCYLAQQFCIKHDITLHAITVDHKLRINSSLEAESTRDFLMGQGINDSVILSWDGEKPKSNIQAIAREKRYSLISDYCKSHGIKHLLTGHHKDDQAETVMLRIMRGSGVDGISGMDESSLRNGIMISRPMLAISRSEIIQCIGEIGWNYCNDPSNENDAFTRVKVRKFLSTPSWMFLSDKLVLLANNSKRASDYLHQQTENFLKDSCTFCQFGTASLDLDAYKKQHEEIALRAMASILMRIGGNSYPPRLFQLERVYAAIHSPQWKNATLWGCFLKARQGRLIVMREESDIPALTEVKAGQKFLWDNRFIIESEIDGYVKLISKHNFHKDLKPLLQSTMHLPSAEVIATLPALFDSGGEMVVIPGVYDNSDKKHCKICYTSCKQLKVISREI